MFAPVDINSIKLDAPPQGFAPVDLNSIKLDNDSNKLGALGEHIQHRTNQAHEAMEAYRNNTQTLPETGLQLLGNAGAGTINDVVGEALNNTPFGFVNKYATQLMMNHGGSDVANAVSDAYTNNTTPRERRNLGAAANLAGFIPAVKGAEAAAPALDGVGPKLAQGLKDLTIGDYDAMQTSTPAKAAPYDPIQGMRGMADTYAANKAQSGALYDKVDDLARGVPVDTSGLSGHLDNLIGDVSSDPNRTAISSLPRLRAYQQKLLATNPAPIQALGDTGLPQQISQEPGKFDLADAVDMRKALNEHFKGNQWNQKAAGTAYADLNGKVGSIIANASKANPQFGQANDLAHAYWLNNLQNPFQDNAVMAKYFRPDDYRELQALDQGKTNALHDETQARAQGTVPAINNAVQLDAVRRVLPDDLAKALSQSVIKAQGSASRGGAATNVAKGLLDLRPHGLANTAKNIADVIGGPQLSPEKAALVKAARTPPPRLSSAADLAAALQRRP